MAPRKLDSEMDGCVELFDQQIEKIENWYLEFV